MEHNTNAAIADMVILDENGSMTIPVSGGTHLSENYVGEHFADYDSYLGLSRFKGPLWQALAGPSKIFPSTATVAEILLNLTCTILAFWLLPTRWH